ncbi:MAG: 4-alpha-glucanotransferase [Pseudomonadota bacterium]
MSHNGQSLLADQRAGVSLHITSLPGDYGVGEIGAQARAFADALKAMGIGVWQFLPTGPTAYGDSPYQPLSTFAGNENLIDIAELLQLGLLTDEEVAPLRQLPRHTVDYGQLIPHKQALLAIAASRFARQATAAQKAGYDAFLETHNDAWLNDYAMFRILKSRHGERPWNEWDPHYAQRDDAALRKLAQTDADKIDAIKTIQYLFFDQWRRFKTYVNDQGIHLFGDMPIYIALDSSDAWANRGILKVDDRGHPEAVAGVPPDYFSEDGQLWGNPLYAWDRHADDDYGWWVDRVRATADLADIVRIDHFRGFEAYWSVPADADTAKSGTWEPGVGDALFDAMKRELGSLPIVAEDLGVITPEVVALRTRHHIPGMHVLQFDVTDPEFDLNDVDENAVCYTGTHDNDTTLGWFHGSPDDIRPDDAIANAQRMALDFTDGRPETIHTDMIRTAFASKARLAVAPMQDYLGLGSEARINVPGTSANNWRWRVTDAQLTPEVCDNVAQMVSASGRGIG